MEPLMLTRGGLLPLTAAPALSFLLPPLQARAAARRGA